VLVTIGDAGEPARLDPLPPNVHVERWVPQADIARHAAAVVCHGGFGTTLGALANGLPLVVVPLFAGDQWHNARRVAQVGAGIALQENAGPRGIFEVPGPPVVAALGEAVQSALDDPAYRRAAGGVADAIADLPPVDAAVDLFRAIANQERTDVAHQAVF
jgi:UDP:flavonoid glycosyltransferase YjiC (YdhE family)